jgi:hypothetical protein
MTYTPALRLTHEDHATLVRLEQFQRAHPGIEIHSGRLLQDKLNQVVNGQADWVRRCEGP